MRSCVAALLLFCSLHAFDPIEYVREEHDKLFFGLGAGCFKAVSGRYLLHFPDYSLRFVQLQAGIGDYPFVVDVRYCVSWSYGIPSELVSGAGAKLTAYEVIPSLRTYLFWKNERVKQYFLSGIIGTQEYQVSAGASHTDSLQVSDGIRYGFQMGFGIDVLPSESAFFTLEAVYKFEFSDLFEKKEIFLFGLTFNIGR